MNKTPNNLLHKAFSSDVSIPDDERAITVTMSTSAVDRDGEVLIPQGCYSKNFERNPVVMMMHNYWDMPIGKVTAIKRGEDSLVAKIVPADRPENHPEQSEWFPDTVYEMFKQQVLNGVSVGFIVKESRPATDKDIEKFGAGCRRVISKWELLELSVCAIPCNQEAVALAVGKGFIRSETAKAVFGFEPEQKEEKSAADPATASNELGDESKAGKTSEAEEKKTADDPRPPEEKSDLPPAPPPAVEPKRIIIFIPPHEAPAKQLNVLQITTHAVQKARGRVYAE